MTLLERLGVHIPLIQAPMGGGATTPELVAAVANAGGFGMLAAAYLSPEQIERQAHMTRALTDRPFGVNLFCGGWSEADGADPMQGEAMLSLIATHHEALGIDPPEPPCVQPDPYPAQLDAVIAMRPAVFSCVFGVPEKDAVERLHEVGALVLGTATTVAEALQLVAVGVDGVIAQGSEAGGHRSTFLGPFEAAMVGTLALVPQMVDAIAPCPVIAAGGIMDGRGIAAALCLGAEAVQMGTAFLACDESGIAPAYKARVRIARDDATRLTSAFSGRPARGLVNAFMQQAEALGPSRYPYPLQNAATRVMRGAAARDNDADRLSLWAGQAAGLSRDGSAAMLVQQFDAEMRSVLHKMGKTVPLQPS